MTSIVKQCRFLLLTLAGCWTTALGQDVLGTEDEGPTGFGVAASAGVLFVNPTVLNNSFTLVNTTLDQSVQRVNTVYPLSVQLRMSVGSRSYLVLRGEFIQFTREFSYDGVETATSGTSTGAFHVTDDRVYRTLPFGLGVGLTLNKKRTIEAEIGFFYAFSTIEESGSFGPYGSFHSKADGSGWGA